MTSICLNFNPENTNVILGKKTSTLWGEDAIEDTIGGIHYRISPQSFYQVNPVQTEKLYRTALEFADIKLGETVWDLYCGIGTISLFIARELGSDGEVIGVEIVPEAIEKQRKMPAGTISQMSASTPVLQKKLFPNSSLRTAANLPKRMSSSLTRRAKVATRHSSTQSSACRQNVSFM